MFNLDNLSQVNIKLPSLEDQQKIINQMESYDKLIELQKKQIDEKIGRAHV